MKKTLLSLLISSSFIAPTYAANTDTSNSNNSLPNLQTVPGYAKLDFLNLKMPNGIPNMGLLGAHYELNILPIPDLYTGPGIYGAITGNQGGFFILGLDNDYRPRLNRYFLFDTGLFIGGGGAHSAQTGDGIVYMPHIGLDYQPWQNGPLFNLSYSYANFSTGKIHSSQIMLAGIMPLDFTNYYGVENQQYQLSNDASQYFIAPFYQNYRTNSSQMTNNAGTVDKNIGLAGAALGKYFNDNFFVEAKASGAGHGNINGYMDVLAGPGLDIQLAQYVHWISDALVGAGGGGNADTHSGVLLAAETGLGWSMTEHFQPRVMIGYLTAPNGNFSAKVISAGFAYQLGLLDQDKQQLPALLGDQVYQLKNFSVSFINQSVINMASKNITNRTVQLMGFNLKQTLTPYTFLAYRSAFAYDGNSAGGMAEGAVGAGVQAGFANNTLYPYADVMIGAIGGGNVDADGGLFYQPELGLDYNFSQNFGAKAFYGRIISFKGPLNNNVIGLGLNYNFGKAVAA